MAHRAVINAAFLAVSVVVPVPDFALLAERFVIGRADLAVGTARCGGCERYRTTYHLTAVHEHAITVHKCVGVYALGA